MLGSMKNIVGKVLLWSALMLGCDGGELDLGPAGDLEAPALRFWKDSCNPLVLGCESEADVCVPNPEDLYQFICVPDASGDEGQIFDACESHDACDAGLTCIAPSFASPCDQEQAGCCLPFCDLRGSTSCVTGGACVSWYEGQSPPPALEEVGLCMFY